MNFFRFLIALCFFFQLESKALVVVVSDLDDTIKITQVESSFYAALNTLTGPYAFQELIELYRTIKQKYEEVGEEVVFVYLSSSPKFIRAESWLDQNNAPKGLVIQRGIWDLVTSGGEQFKFHQLKNYLKNAQHTQHTQNKNNQLKLLMFGDNGEKDPYVYQRILNDKELNLDRNKSHAFIRQAYNHRAKVDDVNYFYTEYDLVLKAPLAQFVSVEKKQSLKLLNDQGDLFPLFVQNQFDFDYPSCAEIYHEYYKAR